MKYKEIVYLGWHHNHVKFIEKYKDLPIDWYIVSDFEWGEKKDLNDKFVVIGYQLFLTKWSIDKIEKFDCIYVDEKDFACCYYDYHKVSRFSLLDI